jgi:hypothetical protein
MGKSLKGLQSVLPVPFASLEFVGMVSPKRFPWKKPRSRLRGFLPSKVLRQFSFYDARTWPDGLLCVRSISATLVAQVGMRNIVVYSSEVK